MEDKVDSGTKATEKRIMGHVKENPPQKEETFPKLGELWTGPRLEESLESAA